MMRVMSDVNHRFFFSEVLIIIIIIIIITKLYFFFNVIYHKLINNFINKCSKNLTFTNI